MPSSMKTRCGFFASRRFSTMRRFCASSGQRPGDRLSGTLAGAGVDWDAAIGVYAAVIFWSRCAGPARLELLAKHGTDAATDAAIRKPG